MRWQQNYITNHQWNNLWQSTKHSIVITSNSPPPFSPWWLSLSFFHDGHAWCSQKGSILLFLPRACQRGTHNKETQKTVKISTHTIFVHTWKKRTLLFHHLLIACVLANHYKAFCTAARLLLSVLHDMCLCPAAVSDSCLFFVIELV